MRRSTVLNLPFSESSLHEVVWDATAFFRMTTNRMRLIKNTLSLMTVSKMIFCRMSLNRMTLGRMAMGRKTFVTITFCRMSLN
jgi:hypothetical protein